MTKTNDAQYQLVIYSRRPNTSPEPAEFERITIGSYEHCTGMRDSMVKHAIYDGRPVEDFEVLHWGGPR